jgi:hypothetical protein
MPPVIDGAVPGQMVTDDMNNTWVMNSDSIWLLIDPTYKAVIERVKTEKGKRKELKCFK